MTFNRDYFSSKFTRKVRTFYLSDGRPPRHRLKFILVRENAMKGRIMAVFGIL